MAAAGVGAPEEEEGAVGAVNLSFMSDCILENCDPAMAEDAFAASPVRILFRADASR